MCRSRSVCVCGVHNIPSHTERPKPDCVYAYVCLYESTCVLHYGTGTHRHTHTHTEIPTRPIPFPVAPFAAERRRVVATPTEFTTDPAAHSAHILSNVLITPLAPRLQLHMKMNRSPSLRVVCVACLLHFMTAGGGRKNTIREDDARFVAFVSRLQNCIA